jgi:hypothetical protein
MRLKTLEKTEMSKAQATKPAVAVPGTAVAKPVETAIVATGSAINFEEDAGAGTEGVDKDSQAIPFLVVLQPLSPAIAEGLIEGAKPGMIMNTVTGELFTELKIVPAAFQRRYVEWAPRKKGGGYKGEHMPVEVESGNIAYRADNGWYFMPGENGKVIEQGLIARDELNQLKDTRSHFVIAVRDDGTFFPALLPLASTQIKKSKKLMSMILGVQLRNASGQLYNPASFSHAYKLTTVKESNDQGTWHGVQFEHAGVVSDPEVYAAGKELNKQVLAGAVKVTQPDENVGADAGEAGDGKGF